MQPKRDNGKRRCTGRIYGSAVFEGNRAYEGEIFRLTDHSQRLVNSAEFMGFEIPFTRDQIDAACNETLAKTGLGDAYIRPFAWRGSDMMGVASKNNKIHLGVAAWHWGNYFPDKMKGRMYWRAYFLHSRRRNSYAHQ